MTLGPEHGGNLDQLVNQYPTATKPWLDLSTGISPWAYPINWQSLTGVVQQLPTQKSFTACSEAMAQAFDSQAVATLPTPGSELVIRLLPEFIQGPLVISPPTYGDYAHAWQRSGRKVITAEHVVEVETPGAVLVVCNPNNPDGRLMTRDALEAIYQQILTRDQWLIVDEAFIELAPEDSLAPLAGNEKLIVLRSTGKFFGLPGLRLGALLAPPQVIEFYRRSLGYWSVSSPALEIGRLAYLDSEWVSQHRLRLQNAAESLRADFDAVGIELAGSTDLFFALTDNDVVKLWDSLMNKGIYTRQFESFGLIRCGLPASKSDQTRLLQALRFDHHGNTSNH